MATLLPRTLFARMTEGETIAEETVLCSFHLGRAEQFTASDASGPHEEIDVENSRAYCQVCGVKQDGSVL
ncbi:hypothetical protein ACT17_06140 [Mycolicibacterium conceptionense]|uniref:Uncharacterized protein n=1 Tax=Mycolicibacterium conceptionense TaxID=451644 RepID=A0A0J8UGV0_9MYCO|nr:hypothetical protein [Mycolicibacterium conceptionense]KMV19620.1 hypothetical protein ACT17_06140 [Mycolicibacterium conceptionense]